MHRRLITALLLYPLYAAFTVTMATVYYVDGNRGNQGNNGKSLNQAFSTIQACVDAVQEPGDECRVRAGRYHEDVRIRGKHGTADQPIIIAGYKNERPVIDGTEVLQATWTAVRGTQILKTTINKDIWQLFIDGQMMTNARWPNALWSDYTVFNNSYWGKSALNATPDKMIDNGEADLAGSELNMTGAMAILNIGSFNTFVAKVLKHTPGSNAFSYNNTFGKHHFKPKNNQYFIEDKLELLDQAGEWFYDQATKTVYVWPPNGTTPKEARGKTQTYAFNITDCHHVHFANMTFFGTTLTANTLSDGNFIDQLVFDSLKFEFPSYSKRMLGVTQPPLWMKINAYFGNRLMKSFRMYNCTFYGTDGAVLQYGGTNITLENNLFEYNDWTGANMATAMGGVGTLISNGAGERFIRNTLRYNGASAGYRINKPRAFVYLNHFHHQCWGLIQNDGAHVQVRINGQPLAMLKQNWAHSSPKYALRFDGQPPRTGSNGTMLMNVAMKTNGIMAKGDYHQVLNNLAFDKYDDQGGDHQGDKCTLCVLWYVRQNPVAINQHSVVKNNAASTANGGKHNNKYYPLPGKVTGNVINQSVRKQVMDADNFDFRPRPCSVYIPDVGPYKYDPTATTYWIPGRQLYKASTPIPPNNSNTVQASRDAIMWLNAIRANAHRIYFGQSPAKVASATTSSSEYRGTVSNGGNVFYLDRGALSPRKTYYWRVDALVTEDEIYKGDVWAFTTSEERAEGWSCSGSLQVAKVYVVNVLLLSLLSLLFIS